MIANNTSSKAKTGSNLEVIAEVRTDYMMNGEPQESPQTPLKPQSTLKAKERTITLSNRSCFILIILITIQLILTLICSGIVVCSAFREKSNLSMERSSYWWYFLFCTLIFVYTLQAFNTIRNENIDSFTCFSIFIVFLAIIEIFVISRFYFVTITPIETTWNWEPICLYFIEILRFITFIITFCYLMRQLNYEKWDVEHKTHSKLEL